MRLPIYQVDAFSRELFGGNPAAVVLLGDRSLPASVLQSIAAENNLSETVFVSGELDRLGIRWFTPTMEVDLCGHATLGAAHVLYELHPDHSGAFSFASRSGVLSVSQSDGRLWLNFPTATLERDDQLLAAVTEALGQRALEVYRGREDLLALLEDERAVRDLAPDIAGISRLPCRGLMATAKGEEVDFVSRFFAPQCGVPEDPVTGSAHTALTPYWAKRLGKSELTARQLSARGGVLWCRDRGERTEIGGEAVTYLRGEIFL